MSKPFAWSYSALTGFETCPRQYHETRILKAWPQEETEAQRWGKEVHKHFEDRIGMGRPLPGFLSYMEPTVAMLERAPGTLRSEYKLALNAQFEPVTFFAKDVWVRAVGDVILSSKDRTTMFAADWKTGRFRDGDDQLRLQSAVMVATQPKVQQVTVSFFWLRDKMTTVRRITRDDVPAIWNDFLPRVRRMQEAIETRQFPPKPSGLCKKHCPVRTCEFWGKGA